MGLETDNMDRLLSHPYEMAAKVQEIKSKYNIQEELFLKMMLSPSILKTVLISDMKLKAGTINIRGTQEKFINGVIIKLTR